MISYNKNLLQIKLMYFFCYAGLSPLISFGPTFAKQLGFSAGSVGFIYFTSVILSIMGRLVFGYLADKFRIHKSLLIFATLLCWLSIISMALLPQQIEKTRTTLVETAYVPHENDTVFELCFINDQRWPLRKENMDGKICSIHCPGINLTICFENGTNCDAVSSFDSVHEHAPYSCLNCLKKGEYKILNDETNEEKSCEITTHSIPSKGAGSVHVQQERSLSEDILLPMFWIYLTIFALYFVTSFIMGVFMDTVCFYVLDHEEGNFGIQRMFASLGWGAAALFSGILTDYVSENRDLKNYLPTFSISFLFLIVTAIFTMFFKMPRISKAAAIDWETLSGLLLNKNSYIFSCWCFVIGVCSAIVWQYSFWVIEDISSRNELTWTKSLQGSMVVVNTFLGDVPTYYFFDRILSKLGYINCMTVTLLLNAIRLFAYSILSNPILALFIAVLDGLTFGISYATIVSYANLISTPETKTIVQAVFSSIFDGIGTSVGALCFGIIYDEHGCSWTFRIGSFMAVGSACLHILTHLCTKKRPLQR